MTAVLALGLAFVYCAVQITCCRFLLALVSDSRSARASLARTVPAGSSVTPSDGPAFHT